MAAHCGDDGTSPNRADKDSTKRNAHGRSARALRPLGSKAEHLADATVDVVHLYDFDRRLSEASTPDWVLYCVAAQAGFDALVARDRSRLDQLVEMSRCRGSPASP